MTDSGVLRADALEAAVESLSEGLAVLDEEGHYIEMNTAHAEIYGYDDPQELVGEHWSVCYGEAELERFESEVMPVLSERSEWQGEATGRRRDGEAFPQEISLHALEDGGLTCIVSDVTERVETERLYRTLAENIPRGAVFLFDRDLRFTVVVGEAFSNLGTTPEELEGSTVYDLFPDERLDDVVPNYETVLDGESAEFEVEFDGRVFDVRLRPLEDTISENAGVGISEDITERRHRETKIRGLHRSSRRLTTAGTVREVASITVEIAREVLDCPVSTLWRYDEAAAHLAPIGMTDSSADRLDVESLEDLQPIPQDRLGMDVFRDGETRMVEDYRTAVNRAFDQPLGAVLLVPLEEYGLLEVGLGEVGTISAFDRRLAEILGANAQAALESAEGEELLRDRTRELEVRTSQLDFVNSIIRHDILNGMTVIRARAAILEDELDGRHEEFADTVVRWSDNITDFVDRVETVLDTLTGEAPVDLEPVDAAALVDEELERLGRTHPAVTFEADLPEPLYVRGDALLADVFGNILSNAVEHNDTEGLRVAVTAENDGERTTVRITDNGEGIPPEQRDAVFRRGESHAKSTGSGFGLFFVDAMVDAYGGSVRVENDDGAVFVLELLTASPPRSDIP